ncbi:hypothetical protein [Kutzneria sp. 744]|uniref:hypothetical protein n=1 Tax=Kutzneria sp. (strain 744) TaxID=345341 RepID=UPI0003EEB667|nr:hypothetical protein [Kutzneria sp. 744]EWM19799.1 hypothetical protein KUTG_10103 [Kutzneria sp. 744]
MAADPHWWTTNFDHPPDQREQFAALGRERSTATSARPERRTTNQASGRRIGEQQAQQRRDVLDQRARELGHADLHDLLITLHSASNTEPAALLGMTLGAAGQ